MSSKPKKKHQRPRGYTLFKTPKADIPFALEPIMMIEGDSELQQFPSALKTKLETYLQRPGATSLTFASKSKHNNSIYTSIENRQTRFVEMGTTDKLAMARYSCGMVHTRREMIVVKPRTGSTFNNGEPAIIMFYGKGYKNDSREIVSRWAIWTPDGIRTDILVDRMMLGGKVMPNRDDNRPGPLKRRKLTRRASTMANYVDGGFTSTTDEDHTPEAQKADENPFNHTSDCNQQQTKHESRDVENNTIVVDYGDVSLTAPDSIPEDTASNLTARTIARPFQGQGGAVDSQPSLPSVDSHNTTNIEEPSMNSFQYARRVSSLVDTILQPTRESTVTKQTIFHFRMASSHESIITKSLAQCNSVHKLYAYARKAGISSPNIMALLLSIGYKSIEVIRDDEEDFDEVLRIINNERVSAGDTAIITIIVTSSQC